MAFGVWHHINGVWVYPLCVLKEFCHCSMWEVFWLVFCLFFIACGEDLTPPWPRGQVIPNVLSVVFAFWSLCTIMMEWAVTMDE